MTGYGREAAAFDALAVTVQVSSVNRRALDLAINLPEEWREMEATLAEQVRQVAARGRVSVVVEVEGEGRQPGAAWDEEAAASALDRLQAFAARENVDFAPSADLLWQITSAQRSQIKLPAVEAAQPVVAETLAGALRAFAAMRAREGEALLVDFLQRVELLHRQVEIIAARAPMVPEAYRGQLMRRLREAGLELDLEDDRVLREIALFADRCDISEELTRLRSHLEQFAHLLKSEAEIGRKAEFILQEVGREVNTIGSKANDLTISRAVIELKNELERVREQMANVE
ncbi:MAG: YicC/YloC family endoribonuclease [Opitutaceae bacterium]